MDLMVRFTAALLSSVGNFLMVEPVFYLFSLFCLVAVIKVFRAFMP